MGNEIKKERLKNGMSVSILHDESSWICVDDIIGNGNIEYYIYGGRRNIDIFTGDKSRSALDWDDWRELLNNVADHYGKNARGEDVVNEMGIDWMALYVLIFSGYPSFDHNHDACLLDPWHKLLLGRAEKWFNANYHVCAISRYEHDNVLYSRGAPTCRWDSGYVGFAITEVSSMSEDDFSRVVDSELEDLTYWANGDAYAVVVEDAAGDHVESCGGYLRYKAAEEAFDEYCKEYENKQDHSALSMLNMNCRVSALAETCEDLGEHTVNIALNQLNMHRCMHMTNDGEQEDVLSDVDHHRLAHLFEAKDHELQDEAAAFVSTYCRHYIKHRLEMM